MTSVSQNHVAALELAEVAAITDLYASADATTISECGLSMVALPSGIVTAASRFDVLALNRVVGLGLRDPVTDDTLAQCVAECARATSPRFFLPVAPLPGHEHLAGLLEGAGCRHYNNWVRLQRLLIDLPPAQETDLTVHEIGPGEKDTFGRIVAAAFGYPPALAPLPAQTIGRPHWHHYLAYDGATAIATAAMYLTKDSAWFGFAATDAEHRKRGAQRALVLRRLGDAAAAGCRSVSVETAEDNVHKDAPSFRNLKRLGFDVAYLRPNYLWTAPG